MSFNKPVTSSDSNLVAPVFRDTSVLFSTLRKSALCFNSGNSSSKRLGFSLVLAVPSLSKGLGSFDVFSFTSKTVFLLPTAGCTGSLALASLTSENTLRLSPRSAVNFTSSALETVEILVASFLNPCVLSTPLFSDIDLGSREEALISDETEASNTGGGIDKFTCLGVKDGRSG